MPTIRRTFSGGVMDKDTDERLIPNGFFRHAENVDIITSEDSDEGASESSLSNKKLTQVSFGENAESIGGYSCSARNKLYWFVVSDSGAYLMEYDVENDITYKVLTDTRPPGDRVLNIKKNKRITGIGKIVGKNIKDDLLLWTDDNIEVCCINIERAKSYAENGFTGNDIFLIKKPPLYAPSVHPLNLAINNNDLKEDFFLFTYRWQYMDGEYSALSSFSKYVFGPKKYNIDYFELINNGMVNQFNAIRIDFNTGEKQVKKIQLCFKKSNSNNIYLIETFDKEKEGWGHNQNKSINFVNNKIYKVLPEKELYRDFDNIPKRAKGLTLAGNRVVLGNYVQGFNMLKRNGDEVKIDYSLDLNSYSLDTFEDLIFTYINSNKTFTFQTPLDLEYKMNGFLNVTINVKFYSTVVFNNTFQFILPQDFSNLTDLVNSDDFQNFVNFINIDFQNHFNENDEWDVPPDYALLTEPVIVFSVIGGIPRFSVTDAIYEDHANGNAPVTIPTTFNQMYEDGNEISPVSYSSIDNSESCKSNMTYAVGFIYRDDFGRSSTIQTNDKNTLHIPHSQADKKNKIQIKINHEAPAWATNFKIAVKADTLTYQVLYINEFYNEGVYVWAKLENANKEKVNVGDYLNVKIAGGSVTPQPIQIKVLDILFKEKNFIENNETESDGNEEPIDIIESEGLYMKIRPSGFSMDLTDYFIEQDKGRGEIKGNNKKPVAYLSLFSVLNDDDTIEETSVGVGSSLKLWIESKRNYKKSGWSFLVFEKTLFASRDYDTVEEWINEELLNGNSIFAEETPGDLKIDIKNDLSLVRGFRTTVNGKQYFVPNGAGMLYLKIIGHYDASPSKSSWVSGDITLRSSTGIFVFETVQKKADTEIFYQLPETYTINAGNHIVTESNGDQDQVLSANTPAVVELSFFNCFSQGNGVESYRVKDDFNTNALNIDSRPTITAIEPFREIHRYADITYGEPYVESSNINGLNEFNASTANWKELNKQDGEIMIVYQRDGNILVVQRNKWGYILYGKDILFNADGTTNVSSIPEVLGSYVPYAGDWGLTDPESFAASGYRCYGVDKERGVVLRLSQDGLTPIVRGMKDWFRDTFHSNMKSRVIGGIDVYRKNCYQITIGNKPLTTLIVACGKTLLKYNQSEPFTYYLQLNDQLGEVQIEYELFGMAILTAEIGGQTHQIEVPSGSGDFTFNRESLNDTQVFITVTPISEYINIELTNICPVGRQQRMIIIHVSDNDDSTLTTTTRMKVNDSQFYDTNVLFEQTVKWNDETGTAGKGKFPQTADIVTVQGVKGNADTMDLTNFKMHYLITDTEYNIGDIAAIISNANRISPNSDNLGSFLFDKNDNDDILYLIFDYRP